MVTIGAKVKRIQPGDYTDGRIGTVIELDAERARVAWTSGTLPDGEIYDLRKPIRTWVNHKCLILL